MKIVIAGDFVPRARVEEMTKAGDYTFFEEVKGLTSRVDYSIVNFESPIVDGEASPIIKTGPNLKCQPNAMRAVKYAGFNCVTLANNHFYDFGEKGVADTLKACRENHIDFVGGGMNLKKAEAVLYKKIGEETLAVVNFCENEWSIATENTGGSAPLNIIRNVKNIHEAKQNADYVIVIVHGGTELYQLPTPRMKETYRFLIEEGADVIVNHHQHCYSGYEIYQDRPIFYGLGNFCFDKNDPNDKLWNEGFAVEINLAKEKVGYKLLPFIQCAEEPKITFLTDTANFEAAIEDFNLTIADDAVLIDAFKKMAQGKSLLQFLEPYSNKYLKKLKAKGLLPSFLKPKRKDVIMEVFRCEAYRDVMFELLKREDSALPVL